MPQFEILLPPVVVEQDGKPVTVYEGTVELSAEQAKDLVEAGILKPAKAEKPATKKETP